MSPILSFWRRRFNFNPKTPTPCPYAPVLTPFFTSFNYEDNKTANWQKISTFHDEIVQRTKYFFLNKIQLWAQNNCQKKTKLSLLFLVLWMFNVFLIILATIEVRYPNIWVCFKAREHNFFTSLKKSNCCFDVDS